MKMKMKKTMVSLGVLVALLVMFGVNPVVAQEKVKFEEKFEKTVNLAKDGKVIIGNISGNIEVKTWNKAQVQIDALKVSRETTLAKAKENMGLVKIVITEENSTLRIKTEWPEKQKKGLNVSITYTLMIPAEASINANTVSGDVICEEISGDLKAETVSGDVIVTGAANGANCSTVSGNVEVDNVTGDVKLHTVSGDVLANKIKGSVDADTVSGSVVLTNITDADEIEASTISGKVKYEGDLASSGYYHLKSHSGRVEFIVPSGSAFDLDARTFSGSINSDFDITVRGKIEKKSLTGSVNGGGAEVELKAFSGNVYIKKK
ncbi:MAG: DUF4097 domain-containing protein, partial [Candidatus Aminicenantes bacterium]|nr:DUF4097 domain-containing protein [Candidatus Aminicenantes bacterium]